MDHSWGASAKLPGRRPPPHWTGRGQAKEGVMFGELRILLFGCFRSTHGWMGMDVWANVRLYNAILVRRSWSVEKDVQGVTWNIRENDIIRQHVSESRCWTQLQRFCVSTVLGKKASTVEESWGAGANRPGRRPPPHWTGRGPANESIMFGEWSILLFFCFRVCFSFCFLRSVHAFMWMCLQCHSCAQTLDRGERCLGPDLQCPR